MGERLPAQEYEAGNRLLLCWECRPRRWTLFSVVHILNSRKPFFPETIHPLHKFTLRTLPYLNLTRTRQTLNTLQNYAPAACITHHYSHHIYIKHRHSPQRILSFSDALLVPIPWISGVHPYKHISYHALNRCRPQPRHPLQSPHQRSLLLRAQPAKP
jgi:hypothetical protein